MPVFATALLFTIWFTAQAIATARSPAPSSFEVNREVFLMGTRVRLQSHSPSREAGLSDLESLIRILEAAEAQLSTWRDSELQRFNLTSVGAPARLSQPLCSLFRAVFAWNRETGRAFDPAVGPLIEAWGIREGGALPSPAQLKLALAGSGLGRIRFQPDLCRATRLTGVKIDAGAFAKGEALDRAFALADRLGSTAFRIDLGGQVAVHGTPPEGFWEFPIAHPAHRGSPSLSVRIAGGSMATSGGSERDLRLDGRRVGHILDPRSGYPASFQGSVTVWRDSALEADILSTALYVMGPEAGLAWAEKRGIAALFLALEAGGTVRQQSTSPFKPFLSPRASQP